MGDTASNVQETSQSRKRDLALVSRSTYLKEKGLQYLFFGCAFLAVVTVLLIFAFTMMQAAPVFTDIGLANFFSFTWLLRRDGTASCRSSRAPAGDHRRAGAGRSSGRGHAVYLTEIATDRVRASSARRRPAGRHPVDHLRLLRHGHHPPGGGRAYRRHGLRRAYRVVRRWRS